MSKWMAEMTDIETKLRYENKYIVTTHQVEMLKCYMEGICFRDDFAGEKGCYNIRSLYFDDYWSNSYWDNEIGIEPRSKFRIRVYNCNFDEVFLEQKIRIGGKIYKERVQVSREFCELLIRDEWQKILYPTTDAVFNRFLTMYHTRILRPQIIIEYDREPYIYPDGDVRITFDRNISFSDNVELFFEKDIFEQPIMGDRQEVLEIKFKNFLPDILYQGINLKYMQQESFSKYYLCEMHKRNGGKWYDDFQ